MTLPDSPHPALADRPAPSFESHREPVRVQLPLGLRARD